MKKLLFATLFLGLIFTLNGFAKITASVDRNQIAPGESFQLILTTEGNFNSVPDLSALNQDFSLLASGQTSETTIINGVTHSRTQWTIALSPKREGEIIIPAIRIDNQFSDPLKIDVVAAAQQNVSNKPQSAYLDASVDLPNPYVQSQIVYKLKLFYRYIGDASLTEPRADNAVIFRLGDDKRYQAQRNGETYQVLERSYAVFPQKSGDVEIEPAVFSGMNLNRALDSNQVDALIITSGQPIRLTSATIKLHVKPIPTTSQSEVWLPAKSLILNESWSKSSTDLHVGDPITRTIIIQAEGVTAAQLPDLDNQNIANVNRYPDKPVTQENIAGETIVAKRIEKTAYIPTQAGRLTLPAVAVHWWNTQRQQMEVANLPAKNFSILPAAIASQPIAATPIADKTESSPNASKPVVIPRVSRLSIWLWATMLLLLLWLITLSLWWRNRAAKLSPQKKTQSLGETKTASLKSNLAAIKLACERNHQPELQAAVITWAKQMWPENSPTNLQAIANRCGDTELMQLLLQLNRSLYSNKPTILDTLHLYRCLKNFKLKPQAAEYQNDLPSLYPNT